MHLVVVRAARMAGGAPGRADCFRRAVLCAAGPRDGLAHVFAEPTEDGVAAILFLLADSIEAAELRARQICQRAALSCGGRFVIAKCEVDLILLVEEARLLLADDD